MGREGNTRDHSSVLDKRLYSVIVGREGSVHMLLLFSKKSFWLPARGQRQVPALSLEWADGNNPGYSVKSRSPWGQ